MAQMIVGKSGIRHRTYLGSGGISFHEKSQKQPKERALLRTTWSACGPSSRRGSDGALRFVLNRFQHIDQPADLGSGQRAPRTHQSLVVVEPALGLPEFLGRCAGPHEFPRRVRRRPGKRMDTISSRVIAIVQPPSICPFWTATCGDAGVPVDVPKTNFELVMDGS